jgi:hypothetical protein
MPESKRAAARVPSSILDAEATTATDLYQQMDDLMALHGRVYQVFVPGGEFLGAKADLASALEAAAPGRGFVLEADRGGVARAFDHEGRRLPI